MVVREEAAIRMCAYLIFISYLQSLSEGQAYRGDLEVVIPTDAQMGQLHAVAAHPA